MNYSNYSQSRQKFWVRLILLILIISAIRISWISPMFTIQSNTGVFIWLLLSLIFDKKSDILNKIRGVFRGAVTLYITVTFLVFAILLQSSGYFSYESLILHYIVPIVFIIDWILTERDVNYRWSFLLIWIIYPIIYLILTMVEGAKSGYYPYFFLDIEVLGLGMFIMWVTILVAVFVILGIILIIINHRLYQS